MPLLLLALLIAIPLVEISVFIEVGARIGGLATIVITVLTAVVGLYLVRLEGLIVLTRMRNSMAMGEIPLEQMFHGFFLFLAGILLLVPGFVTDAIGALLLLPVIRSLLARPAIARMLTGFPPPPTYRDRAGHIIIEGQFEEEDDERENHPRRIPEDKPDDDAR